MKPPVLDFFDFDSTPFWLSLRRTFSHSSEEEVRLKKIKIPPCAPDQFFGILPTCSPEKVDDGL